MPLDRRIYISAEPGDLVQEHEEVPCNFLAHVDSGIVSRRGRRVRPVPPQRCSIDHVPHLSMLCLQAYR